MPSYSEVDSIFADFFNNSGAPGLSYAVTHRGEVIHEGGLGVTYKGGVVPNSRSVFRIASMTKSFTAAAILLLRDEGVLSLDAPISEYLPEMKAVPTPQGVALTMRQLLSMSGGFPTDDAWADRQEAMTPDELSNLMSAGFDFISTPNTQFEYANLGYTLSGRVISQVTGTYFTDFVQERILTPLAMTNTAFRASDINSEHLTRGHTKRDSDWIEEDFSDAGEFSPLGGMFSCVDDLAKWVGGFVSAFDDSDGNAASHSNHPLAAASRREMQQGYRMIDTAIRFDDDELIRADSLSYGFGLIHESNKRFGSTVSHSGGYPGYGTHMRWHLASGYGIIALANSTYAPSNMIARKAHDALLRQIDAPSAVVRVWPATRSAQDTVSGLLRTWDDAIATTLFSNNVDMDEPRDLRKAAIVEAVSAIGGLGDFKRSHVHTPCSSEMNWREHGLNGYLDVTILLTALHKVQELKVTAVTHPSSELVARAQTLIEQYADQGTWDSSIEFSDPDAKLVALRQFAIATALDAPLQMTDNVTGSNGTTKAQWEISGAKLRWMLDVELDGEILKKVTLTLKPLQASDYIRSE